MCAEKMAYASGLEASPPQSAFNEASTTLDEARGLAHRVTDLVDRLCGSRPTEIVGKDGNGIPASVFANLREEASRTSNAIRSAMDQLNRLERELP